MSATFLKWFVGILLTGIMGFLTFFTEACYNWAIAQLPVDAVLPPAVLPYVGIGSWLALKLRFPEIISLYTSATLVRMTIRCVPFVGKIITGA